MSNEFPFKVLSDADLLDVEYTKRDELEGLLEGAVRILKHHKDDSRLDSVAWRLADAGLLLRRIMEGESSGWSKVKGVQGIHCPTGMGATLPEKPS